MSSGVRARGLARKKSGEFQAAVVLEFESPIHARDALLAMGVGWARGEKHHHCLAWIGTPEAFEKCKQVLIGFGADPTKLHELHKPGEKFFIDIPTFNSEAKILCELV